MTTRNKLIMVACLYSMLSIFLFPGEMTSKSIGYMSYGFPHRFITFRESAEWLITTTSIDLLFFGFNALYMYVMLAVAIKLYHKLKPYKGGKHD